MSRNSVSADRSWSIHPLLLHFRDARSETAFNRSWLKGTVAMTRIWAVCGIFFYVLFGIAAVIWCVPAEEQGFLWGRFFVTVPVMLLSLLPVFLIRSERIGSANHRDFVWLGRLLDVSYFTPTWAACFTSLWLAASLPSSRSHPFFIEAIVVFFFPSTTFASASRVS